MKLNSDNYVIGVTGGVGSGKSMVLYVLENECGAKVYQADRIGRSLMAFDGPVRTRVIKLFGEEIVFPDGTLDRDKIAEIIFNNPEKLQAQNDIIHPAVRRFLRTKASGTKGFVVLEAALPEESNFAGICDEIWYVHTDRDIRINRLIESRGYSREKCEDIMDSQLSDDVFKNLSDKVIENSGSLEAMESQVKSLVDSIKQKYPEIFKYKADRSEDTKSERK